MYPQDVPDRYGTKGYAVQPLVDTDPDPDRLVGTTVWNTQRLPFPPDSESNTPDSYQVTVTYDLRR
jgi:hypothetical protein